MTAPIETRPGRNEPCHCGSGKKYKHCCLPKDEARQAKARAQTAAVAAETPAEPATETTTGARTPKTQTHQPWKATTSRGFVPRTRSPRKVGGS